MISSTPEGFEVRVEWEDREGRKFPEVAVSSDGDVAVSDTALVGILCASLGIHPVSDKPIMAGPRAWWLFAGRHKFAIIDAANSFYKGSPAINALSMFRVSNQYREKFKHIAVMAKKKFHE